jgi:mRNA interferase MazF
MTHRPCRGEVWWVNLDPVVGNETAKTRPALVVSIDRLNHSGAGLVWVIPMTTKDKKIRSHVATQLGGVPNFIKCEELRALSVQRLTRLVGTVDSKVMAEVEYAVARFLGLE